MLGIDPMEWASFTALGRRLGWWRAVRLGLALRRRVDAGEPFAALPETDEKKEADSRAQIAPAVVLYRLLCEEMKSDEALVVVGDVVEAGAHVFLKSTIGPISRDLFHGLEADARHALLDERVDRFPNTVYQIEEAGTEKVRFTVSMCRFVRLCKLAGVPELTPVFCAVDASYFSEVEPSVELSRPTTLAQGDTCCDFTLRFSDSAKTSDDA